MADSMHWNGVDLDVTVGRFAVPFSAPVRDNGVDLTGRDGGFAARTLFSKSQLVIPIVVQGVAVQEPAQTARENFLSRLETLKKALNTRATGELYLDALDDRQWLCRYAGASEIQWAGPNAGIIELRFIADDPFAYSRTLTTAEVSVNSTQKSFTLTPGGSAEVRPVFVIEAGASSAALVVLENEQRGERLSWGNALASGKDLRIDCARQIVEISDAGQDDWVSSMLLVDGVFPSLSPGVANDMVLYGVGSGATLTATWRDRYL